MCNFSLQYPYTAKLAFDGNQENDQWQDIAETVIWNTQVFKRVPLSRAQISLCLKLNVLGCFAVGDLCSRPRMDETQGKLFNGRITIERLCQLNLHLNLWAFIERRRNRCGKDFCVWDLTILFVVGLMVIYIGISRYFTVFHGTIRFFFAGDEIYQGRAPSSAHELCNKCWKCEDPGRTS